MFRTYHSCVIQARTEGERKISVREKIAFLFFAIPSFCACPVRLLLGLEYVKGRCGLICFHFSVFCVLSYFFLFLLMGWYFFSCMFYLCVVFLESRFFISYFYFHPHSGLSD